MTEESSAEASEMDHVKKGTSSTPLWPNNIRTHLNLIFTVTELKELKTKGKTEFKDLKQDFHELKQDFGRAKGLFRKAKDKLERAASPSRTPRTSSEVVSAPAPNTKDSAPKEKVKMSLSLASLIVYTVGVKCRGFNKKERYAPEHLFSLSEKTANKILKESMGDLIKHNRTHVVRVYPNGMRVDSSNYEPHRYWASGTQLVAINWQTFGQLTVVLVMLVDMLTTARQIWGI